MRKGVLPSPGIFKRARKFIEFQDEQLCLDSTLANQVDFQIIIDTFDSEKTRKAKIFQKF